MFEQVNKKITKADKSVIDTPYKFDIVSECIARKMIDKIISYTITEVNRTRLDAKITKHCYTYANSLFDNFISGTGIFYDRDDTKEIDDEIFYDNVYRGVNDWSNIDEPVVYINLG